MGPGRWAWEAPRVSGRAPLPQPLPAPTAQWGHHLSSHTCATGLCTRKHILSLLLKHTHAQAYTPILKQSRCTKESKHKPTGSLHTHSQTRSYTLTRTHPWWCPKLHNSTPAHTQEPHTHSKPPLCRSARQQLRTRPHKHQVCMWRHRNRHSGHRQEARSWKLRYPAPLPRAFPVGSHTLRIQQERPGPTSLHECGGKGNAHSHGGV